MLLFKQTIALVGILVLSSCGFSPLYGDHQSTNFANIEVLPIENRTGQQFRNELIMRLNSTGHSHNPRYQLKTTITESKQNLAVQITAFATRANLLMTANFTLYDTVAKVNVFQGVSKTTVGYNTLSSDFATTMAEKGARTNGYKQISEDIRLRLGIVLKSLSENGSAIGS